MIPAKLRIFAGLINGKKTYLPVQDIPVYNKRTEAGHDGNYVHNLRQESGFCRLTVWPTTVKS